MPNYISTQKEILEFVTNLQAEEINFNDPNRKIIKINFEDNHIQNNFNELIYASLMLRYNINDESLFKKINNAIIDSASHCSIIKKQEHESFEQQKAGFLILLADNHNYKAFCDIVNNDIFDGNPWINIEHNNKVFRSAANQIFKASHATNEDDVLALKACMTNKYAPQFMQENSDFIIKKIKSGEIHICDFMFPKNKDNPRSKKWDQDPQEVIIKEIEKEFQIAKLAESNFLNPNQIKSLFELDCEEIDEIFKTTYTKSSGVFSLFEKSSSSDNEPKTEKNMIRLPSDDESDTPNNSVKIKESRGIFQRLAGCLRARK